MLSLGLDALLMLLLLFLLPTTITTATTRVVWLLCGEIAWSYLQQSSTDSPVCRTGRETVGRWHITRYSIMLSRAKKGDVFF